MLRKGLRMIAQTGLIVLGIAAVLGIVAAAFSSRTASALGPRDHAHRLEFGRRTRTYEVHLPPNYDGKTPLPVILNLHGGGGNATAHRRQTQMDRASDKFGFIVVYPEGTSGAGRFYTWNAGICCSYAMKWKVDDVGFINRLLDVLPQQYAIDSNRVYCTGMSNGAMMSYRLACELSERITAICAVGASMGVDGPRPKRPVPIMEIHGLKDPNSLFEGGVGPNAIAKVNHRPVRDVIKWWCEVNNCELKPVEVVKKPDYIMERYAPPPGEEGAPVVLNMLIEGGHTWPGGVDVTPRLGTGKLIATFDADAVMWEFFRKFSLDKQPPAERRETP